MISATLRRFEKLISSAEWWRKSGFPSSRKRMLVWYWPKKGTQGGLMDRSFSRYCLKWSATRLVASSSDFNRVASRRSFVEINLWTALLLRQLVMARTPLKLLYSCSTIMISSTRLITATRSSMLSVSRMVFSRYLVKLVVCLTILSRLGLLLSLSSRVQARSTSSEGLTAR